MNWQSLKVNQEIPVYVLNPEDNNGNLVLSYMRAREEVSWLQIETHAGAVKMLITARSLATTRAV